MSAYDITGKTSVYGLIGESTAHSFSPIIYNYLFSYYEIDSVYLGFSIENSLFEYAAKGIKALGLRGMNITNPYKEKIIQYIDEIYEPEGVINVIKNVDCKLYGYNTDYHGVKHFFEGENIDLKDKSVLIFGAGGTSKTICRLLSDLKIKQIVILNRNVDKSEMLLKFFSKRRILCKNGELNSENINKFMINADMIINATSCDLLMNTNIEINFDKIRNKNTIFFDVIYNPRTKLIDEALKKGYNAFDGLQMLIYQAFKSFEIWTGIYPDNKCYEEIIIKLRRCNL